MSSQQDSLSSQIAKASAAYALNLVLKKIESLADALVKKHPDTITKEEIVALWKDQIPSELATPKKGRAATTDKNVKCVAILQGGKRKDQTCDKACLIGLNKCKTHAAKDAPAQNKDKEIHLCPYTFTKGSNEGKLCGEVCMSGKNACASHEGVVPADVEPLIKKSKKNAAAPVPLVPLVEEKVVSDSNEEKVEEETDDNDPYVAKKPSQKVTEKTEKGTEKKNDKPAAAAKKTKK
jgi:hypothetical protein